MSAVVTLIDNLECDIDCAEAHAELDALCKKARAWRDVIETLRVSIPSDCDMALINALESVLEDWETRLDDLGARAERDMERYEPEVIMSSLAATYAEQQYNLAKGN